MFACVANAGRSQMAAAIFNALADPDACPRRFGGHSSGHGGSSGSGCRDARARHRPLQRTPQYLSTEITKDAHILITMGCGDECPLVPGVERDDWPLEDPKEKPIALVRQIRDDIKTRVTALIKERRWA